MAEPKSEPFRQISERNYMLSLVTNCHTGESLLIFKPYKWSMYSQIILPLPSKVVGIWKPFLLQITTQVLLLWHFTETRLLCAAQWLHSVLNWKYHSKADAMALCVCWKAGEMRMTCDCGGGPWRNGPRMCGLVERITARLESTLSSHSWKWPQAVWLGFNAD